MDRKRNRTSIPFLREKGLTTTEATFAVLLAFGILADIGLAIATFWVSP
jgi:hypothetical protein